MALETTKSCKKLKQNKIRLIVSVTKIPVRLLRLSFPIAQQIPLPTKPAPDISKYKPPIIYCCMEVSLSIIVNVTFSLFVWDYFLAKISCAGTTAVIVAFGMAMDVPDSCTIPDPFVDGFCKT
uniref:Uncharacterized protein n=1 Tax=Romanomermis culicivorax TaxID=13658 RepID=A0A915IXT3_ROMCU